MENYSYENLLKRNKGILAIQSKMPIRDRSALSLVYTPGVGASCLEIKNNPQKSLDLTNKKNSMVILTDSSGFKDKCNKAVFPYLEAICVYYKIVANIDCYPMIINHNSIRDGKELADTVNAIMPGFSLVEFFNVDKKRIDEFILHANGKYAYIGYGDKRDMDSRKDISVNLIYAGIIRAALDLHVQKNLNECVRLVLDFVDLIEKGSNISTVLVDIVSKACEIITGRKQKDVQDKITSYILEGKDSWIDEYPNNYYIHKNQIDQNSLLLHYRYKGVIETCPRLDIKDIAILEKLINWDNLDHISSLIYKNPELINQLTCKANFGSVITNGTAILGFGDIGTLAGLPVMEGKGILFKLFGGMDVMPLCVDEKDPRKFIEIVKRISPTFSAINLEDIKAPDCFLIENTLIDALPYPVFHDDQHGTAIVVLAGIINALRYCKRDIKDVKIIMNGAGAAGLSVTELLLVYGAKNLIICDTSGAIYTGREKNMNAFKNKLAELSNPYKEKGTLNDVLKGADIFIGVSAPNTLTQDMIKTMKPSPIIFALANPLPEIMPGDAYKAGAAVVATGRSDFKNQVNNSLAFPGIFRAAIDTHARKITIDMKLAAAKGIANLIKTEELSPDYIIPDSLDSRVPVAVTKAVSQVVQNKEISQDHIEDNILGWMLEARLRNWEQIRAKNLEFVNSTLRPKF